MEILRQGRPGRRACLSQYWRWSSTWTQALVLCVVVFLVVLPLCCHRLLYSYFFFRFLYLDSMSEQALQESHQRGQEALRFWQDASAHVSHHFSQVSREPELLVTVVTSRRPEGRDSHYLLQVMQRLAALLDGCGDRRCAEVLLCDVQSGPRANEDAALLETRFRVVRRWAGGRRGGEEGVNTFEKEKRDYVFCLRSGWELLRPKHLVVLEDDALPRPDFFPVIRDLLSRRFAHRSLYVKLYHPERLQRYWNPEPYRVLEWLGVGLLGASLALLLLPYCNPCRLSFTPCPRHLLFLCVFTMTAAELAGRHYLLELRRASPQLYAVAPATECCTPAMLFPGNASMRAAAYLDGAFCAKGNAKDLVLFQMGRAVPGERAHSVEPNLVTHIGAYSSVRENPPRPKLL